MGLLPTLIPIAALVATGLGLFNVVMTNASRCPVWACWSRRCFVLVFLAVAVSCVVMAVSWPRGVLPFGLAMAVLFLGVLWPQRMGVIENESV